ncbi:hypothetical protein ACFWP2_00385 [Kitasatospora sp. NPDC058444]|uniref:hypothetical protein n=1 Tax=Kitasatospora sp. NPDC058444 TaxID=3346504 RepID=UPI00364D8E33
MTGQVACGHAGFLPARLPHPLLGGGADQLWDRRIAESTGHEVLDVPAADHGLELPDDPLGSIDVLRRVAARLDRFVASLAAGR